MVFLGEPESGVSRKGPFRASLVAGRLRKGWQDTLWGLQLWHMVCLHRVTDVNDLIGQRAPRAVSFLHVCVLWLHDEIFTERCGTNVIELR